MVDWALELAENPNTYVPLRQGHRRFVDGRYVLWLGSGDRPGWNSAQRFRFPAAELAEVRAEIHASLRARERSGCTWEVGSSARPSDLVERLLELGLVEDEEPLRIGMALSSPPSGSAAVEVKPAASDDDRRRAQHILSDVYNMPYVEPPAADPAVVVFLAYLDGRPVGRATGSYGEHGVSLSGAAVLPGARGRGAYRALVHARWHEAVARGTPLAVVDAGRRSRPILARMGFRQVCTIRALVDRVDQTVPVSSVRTG